MLYNMTYFDIVYLCIKVRLYCSRCLCSFNLYSDVLSRNKKRREDWHWLTVLIFKKTHSSFICKVGATDNHLQLPFYTVCVYTSRKSFDNRTNLWSLIPHLTASIFHTQGRTFWSLFGPWLSYSKKNPRKELSCAPLTILILLLGDIITQFLISLATSQYSQEC